MTPRLELRGVRKMYEGGDGVLGIDLTVMPGEIHAIVGLNGAGKSTLMRLALGISTADAGWIGIDAVPVPAARWEIWAGVGHLLETPLAYPELTVQQNLRLSARLHGLDGPAADAAVSAIIGELGLEKYASRRAGRLSLGNRQRVGLAAALQHFPQLVVLDEPSNALDPAGVILLRKAIARRARAGAGVLISSHHLDEVSRIAHRITVINGGRVVGQLDPSGIDIERAFFAIVHADDESGARVDHEALAHGGREPGGRADREAGR